MGRIATVFYFKGTHIEVERKCDSTVYKEEAYLVATASVEGFCTTVERI